VESDPALELDSSPDVSELRFDGESFEELELAVVFALSSDSLSVSVSKLDKSPLSMTDQEADSLGDSLLPALLRPSESDVNSPDSDNSRLPESSPSEPLSSPEPDRPSDSAVLSIVEPCVSEPFVSSEPVDPVSVAVESVIDQVPVLLSESLGGGGSSESEDDCGRWIGWPPQPDRRAGPATSHRSS